MKRNSIVVFLINFAVMLIVFSINPASAKATDVYFTHADVDGGIKITGYTGTDNEIIIPSSIDGKSVVKIGEDAFLNYNGKEGKPNITAVTIPEEVETIGVRAFYLCNNLTKVNLLGVPKLCTIGNNAFANTEITSFAVPEGVETIGDNAFSFCRNLTDVSFLGASKLRSIGNGAFAGTGLTSFTAPEGVETLGDGLFGDCKQLTTVKFPSSAISIGCMVSEDLDSLQAINVDLGNKFYSSEEGVFFNKDKTDLLAYPRAKESTHYAVPNTVTTIQYAAFWLSTNLEKVTLPNSLKNIGREAFLECTKLKEITIPKSLTTLGQYSFIECTSLETVTILNKTLPLDSNGIYFHCYNEYYDTFPITLTIRGYVGSTAETYANLYEEHTFEEYVEKPVPVMEGNGSIENPYQIDYIEQLQAIGTGDYGLDKCYVLENNLDFQDNNSYYNLDNKTDFTTGLGFKPIGDIEAMDFNPKIHMPFRGSFDGNGKKISNLFINRPVFNEASTQNGGITVGLFGGTMGNMAMPCIIKNLELISPNITGANRVGALVAASMFTRFENCKVTGGQVIGTAVPNIETNIENFVGRTTSTGGMLGMVYAKGSGIYNCFSSATVTGTDCVGGLVGYNYGNEIQRSFSTGSVNGQKYVGGLAGCNIGSAMEMPPSSGNYTYFYSKIENSYATGDVISTEASKDTGTGGLVGYNHVFAEVNNTYALGNVSGTNNCGGLIGHNNLGAITYSYATGNVIGTGNAIGGLIGLHNSLTSDGGVIHKTALKNSVAFNDQVSGSSLDIGKVIGKCIDSKTVSNCYANEAMTISENGNDVMSGTGISKDTFKNSGFYETSSNWNENAWNLVDVWAIGANRPMLRIKEPVATEVSITGIALVGKTLTGSYRFNKDIEGNAEYGSKYKWYVATDVNGTNKTAITGATSLIYTLESSNKDAYMAFEVTPSDGIDTGNAVMSSWIGPITAASYTHSSHKSSDNDYSNGSDVYVNGEKYTAGHTNTMTENGKRITTVTVDLEKMNKLIESKDNGATVTIPVLDNSAVSCGLLTGQMVKNMEKNEAILEIKTKDVAYTLPASQIDIDSVAKQFHNNTSLSDIEVAITVSEPGNDTVKVVENSAQDGGFTIVIKPVEFIVNCSYKGKEIEVNNFKSYVNRTVRIPYGTDAKKITTAVVVEPNGTTRHVPTKITQKDGIYYAVINSLTNSVYTVIYNPVELTDAHGHWACESINDMASRKVINGYTNGAFVPDGDITRAEFAAIIIRALGLPESMDSSSFSDINTENWCCGAVQTAVKYGLIKGYSDGTFGMNDKITREQVMTIIARAMKVTGLDEKLTTSGVSASLDGFVDAMDISAYARQNAVDCFSMEVIKGKGNNKLAPKANITRAEVAVIAKRLLQKSELI